MIYRNPRPRKEPKVSWRTGAVKETAKGMVKLRKMAYDRSEGMCECQNMQNPPFEGTPCKQRVNYRDGQLHHLWPRSDVIQMVKFIHRDCHRRIHGDPQWALRCRAEAEAGA